MLYTIFACLYSELVEKNTLTGSKSPARFYWLSAKQFSKMTIQKFKTNLKELKAKI